MTDYARLPWVCDLDAIGPHAGLVACRFIEIFVMKEQYLLIGAGIAHLVSSVNGADNEMERPVSIDVACYLKCVPDLPVKLFCQCAANNAPVLVPKECFLLGVGQHIF